jgi:hypothetical protein
VHLVALAGSKVDQTPAPHFTKVGTARHLKRAIEHRDPCVLVDLVIREELVLLERERDHPSCTVIRPQDLGPPRFGRESGDLPNVHEIMICAPSLDYRDLTHSPDRCRAGDVRSETSEADLVPTASAVGT